MIVLGLSLGELASAALMVDGMIVAAASEERFSRIKNDESYPRKAIEYCLNHAGVNGDNIDVVAIASIQADLWHRLAHYYSKFSIMDYIREQHEYWYPTLYLNKKLPWHQIFADKLDLEQYPGSWGDLIRDLSDEYYLTESDMGKVNQFIHETIRNHIGVSTDRIHHVEHHAAHASYAYWASPFRQEATILTIDAYGDGLSASVSIVKNNDIHRLKSINHKEFQLARMYRYTTLILGMKPNEHEYKVMGLAPYSKYDTAYETLKIYQKTMYVDGLDFKYHEKPQDMYFYFKNKLEGQRFDGIAGGLQSYTEQILTQWIRNCIKKTGIGRLVVAGGVAMNVKAMKSIADLPEVVDLFVPPSPGDESLAIGVCYDICRKRFGVIPAPLENAYLGPDVSSSEIQGILKQLGNRYRIINKVQPSLVAEQLIQGRIVARCAGRMEFGARALGNRSILADVRSAENIKRINEKIKNRDFWMPFAPAILAGESNRLIRNPKSLKAPYMTIAFDTTVEGAKQLAAGIHPADRTCRPQMVDERNNPSFSRLIHAFKERTGVGALLNTSFNLHGEPIVCSARDALRVFELSDIDDLLLGDTLISKIKNHH